MTAPIISINGVVEPEPRLDTPRYSKRLQSADVSKEQAEALYEAVATRTQPENTEQRLSAETTGLGQELRARIDNVEQRLSAEIKQLRWMSGMSISLSVAILIKLLVA